MCGRFTLVRLIEFLEDNPWIAPPEAPAEPRHNIAPSQIVAVVPNDGRNAVQFFHWGLIPSWAKDPSIGNRMINARSETLADKPSFRTSLKRRRCLIPASGFYEWRKQPGGGKTPMYVRLKTHRPLALAGLWDTWHDPAGSEVRSFTIITVPPNELMASIHDRMPAILLPDDYHSWLAPGEHAPADLQKLLYSHPAERMEAYPVGKSVNSPRNQGPQLIEPVEPSGLFGAA